MDYSFRTQPTDVGTEIRREPEGPASDPGSADAALEALDDDLKARLAMLGDAPERIAELAIGLMPMGYRSLLEGYDLVEAVPLEGSEEGIAEGNDPRQRLHLTDLGRAVIAACAQSAHGLRPDVDLDERAERLKTLYGYGVGAKDYEVTS
jgi:hypothetical protein